MLLLGDLNPNNPFKVFFCGNNDGSELYDNAPLFLTVSFNFFHGKLKKVSSLPGYQFLLFSQKGFFYSNFGFFTADLGILYIPELCRLSTKPDPRKSKKSFKSLIQAEKCGTSKENTISSLWNCSGILDTDSLRRFVEAIQIATGYLPK